MNIPARAVPSAARRRPRQCVPGVDDGDHHCIAAVRPLVWDKALSTMAVSATATSATRRRAGRPAYGVERHARVRGEHIHSGHQIVGQLAGIDQLARLGSAPNAALSPASHRRFRSGPVCRPGALRPSAGTSRSDSSGGRRAGLGCEERSAECAVRDRRRRRSGAAGGRPAAPPGGDESDETSDEDAGEPGNQQGIPQRRFVVAAAFHA